MPKLLMSELLHRAETWRQHAGEWVHSINSVTADRALPPEDILTPEELADRLKISRSWVFEKTRARCRNPMPCLRLGRYIRFDWTAVVDWLRREATQENATRSGVPQARGVVR